MYVFLSQGFSTDDANVKCSLSGTSRVDLTKSVLGLSVAERRLLRLPVLFSMFNHSTSLFRGLLSVISSDFENKFVCGEIMSYDDLHELGSEAAVKAAGKLRQQGKPYESELLRSFLAYPY